MEKSALVADLAALGLPAIVPIEVLREADAAELARDASWKPGVWRALALSYVMRRDAARDSLVPR